ncbi:heme biosynthesis protein HemY, partial [Mesorhizobium sp. M6A.T.Cr.TU.017.01.1.1]
MERLGQLIDSNEDAADATVPTIAAPIKPAKENVIELNPAVSAERPTTATASESDEDQVAPVTAAAFAAVPPDAESVEPAEELARLPDDPGVDPDDEDQKSPRKFRLF